jgi:hypothetical protein
MEASMMKRLFTTATALMLAGTLTLGQASRAAEAEFKAAQHKEEVEGDFKGAIEIYKKISEGRDHTLAAKALLALGQAAEKSGSLEAKKIYESILRDYSDQRDIAGQAKARLAALSELPEPEIKRNQLLLIDIRSSSTNTAPTTPFTPLRKEVVAWPRWAPDKSHIAFDSGKDLIVRSVVTGSERIYPQAGIGDMMGWSGDSKDILIQADYEAGQKIISRLNLGTGERENIGIVKVTLTRKPWAVISANERTVYILSSTNEIVSFDLTKGTETDRVALTLPAGAQAIGPLSLSPDEKQFAVVVDDPGAKGTSLSLFGRDGKLLRGDLYTEVASIRDLAWMPDGRAIVLAEYQTRGSQIRIARIPVTDGDALVTLFETTARLWNRFMPDLDISPDGSWLVFDGIAAP